MAKIKIDFTGVETNARCEEGQHFVKLTAMEEKTSQAGNDMLVGSFEVVKGDSKGSKLYENFLLSQSGLWKLKSYLQAIGVACDGKIALDPKTLIGKQCIATVVHEEYNGKTKAKIDEFKKIVIESDEDDDDEDFEEDDTEDEVEDDDDEEEEAPKKPSKKTGKGKKVEEEPEDDEEDEEEDEEDEKSLEDMSLKELKEMAKGLKIKGYKDMKKKQLISAIQDMTSEDDEDDDEDWDDED